MKTKLLFTSTMLLCIVSVLGQKLPVDITFTAIRNAAYTQLDSIKVMNRTQGGSSMLYWPDTTLTYEITPGDLMLYVGYSSGSLGVKEISQDTKQFQLFQNYPNPVKDQCLISMYIPEKGTVNIKITDLQGRVFIVTDVQLDNGNHSFRFTPGGSSLFFLTAWWNGISRSIKIVTAGLIPGKKCMLDYTGSGNGESALKATPFKITPVMQESGILDTTVTNETYTFEFATNIPCPGTPTVEYEGQVYNTIQIFSQCWLKENLNVGTIIQGGDNMTDNGIKEKYCYDNDTNNCITYGGLYRWDEMMQYTIQLGTRGLCPPDWHLPTDEEWKVLEGAVDSQYGIGDEIWDTYNYRGFDASPNLKALTGWYTVGNGTDLFGFSGLPGGHVLSSGTFLYLGSYGVWWTSTENIDGEAWFRSLSDSGSEVNRAGTNEIFGHSVRCVRNE
jgi:uncharacterized protein (TIGR02145 family)